MKVALLTTEFFNSKDTFIVGGWIQSLIAVLQQSDCIELAVVGLTNANSVVEQEGKTTFYKIHYSISPNPLQRIYQKFRCKIDDEPLIQDYLQAIQAIQPDIVQIFGTENLLCRVIPYLDCKVVVHLQGLLNPYNNAFFPPGVSAELFCRKSFNLFYFLRGMGYRQRLKTFQAMANRERAYFETIRFVMGRTDWDKMIAQSLAKEVTYFHLAEVLRSDFYTAQAWQPQQRKIVQFISVLSPFSYKGFDVILKTAALLKHRGLEFQWKIAGSSEQDSEVRTMEKITGEKYDTNHIQFLGKQTAQEVTALMLDADLFIHPSYIENSPNSVCEAQMLGLPVVAANVGGVSSLINNDKTGILFPANDVFLLSEIITTLLSDTQKRKSLGAEARKVALERHDRKVVLANIENIYQEIVKYE